MSGLIPRAFIDQLLSMTDLVQLIDERVPLKKAGKNFTACCPFHTEKSPSFNVNPSQQFYHCFGCGVSGNAISFLMEYDRLDFVSSIEYLAHQHGLLIPYEQKAGQKSQARSAAAKTDAYDLLLHIAKLYKQQLKASTAATDYLKGRGLSGEVAKRYGIGFAPAEWRFLTGQLAAHMALLEETGMVISKDEGQAYDRFRQRIMFPIRDARGRIIAFGGRVINDEQPKYLNSPETPYFHKGRELYGLYEARQANRELRELVVVEGYMDVVALAQHGITTAVATLGTATSTEHIEKLSRLTPTIVFCFDGDRAGRQAAWRALQSALPALTDHVTLKFLFLPDGEDPDSYVRRFGADAFRQALAEAQPLSAFFFNHLLENCPLGTAEGKAKLVHDATPLLAKIPNDIALHKLLVDELAQLSKFNRSDLTVMAKAKTARFDNSDENYADQPMVAQVNTHRLSQSPMRVAMQLLLQHPTLAGRVSDTEQEQLQQLTLPGASLLHSLLERCRYHQTLATILESYRDQPEFSVLLKLSAMQSALEMSEEVIQAEWAAVIKKLFSLEKDHRIQKLQQLLRERLLTAEERAQLLELLKTPS